MLLRSLPVVLDELTCAECFAGLIFKRLKEKIMGKNKKKRERERSGISEDQQGRRNQNNGQNPE